MFVPMVPYCPKDAGTGTSVGRCLGHAYNRCMERLYTNDIAILMDHDLFLPNPRWYRLVEEAWDDSYGLMTCVASDIGCIWQQAHPAAKSDSISEHVAIAAQRERDYGSAVTDVTNQVLPIKGPCWGPAGFFLVVPKSTWLKVKFEERGMTETDNNFGRSVAAMGMKIGLIEGLYVYHHRWGSRIGESHYGA